MVLVSADFLAPRDMEMALVPRDLNLLPEAVRPYVCPVLEGEAVETASEEPDVDVQLLHLHNLPRSRFIR